MARKKPDNRKKVSTGQHRTPNRKGSGILPLKSVTGGDMEENDNPGRRPGKLIHRSGKKSGN